MIIKNLEKRKAIDLRKRGFSYSEILKELPVAKSTISLWLREVGLSKKQKQRITEKKLKAGLRGANVRKQRRILLQNEIYRLAEAEIKDISERELWLMGIMLYWAEGSKEKEGRPGSGVQFSNSDPRMIKFFLLWLKRILKIPDSDICFEIYIHENNLNRSKQVINFWINSAGFSESQFKRIYFKKNKIRTNRKNVGDTYYGVVKIRVKRSSYFNRKIAGWVNGVVNYSR